MISYWKAIYQIKRILERSKITDETRHDDEFILDKILQYRAMIIQMRYNRIFNDDPSWWSNLGIINTETVLSSDAPDLVTTVSLTLSKIALPPAIQLKGEWQYMNLYTVSQQEKIYPISFSKFMSYLRVNDPRIQNYYHIMPIGEHAYIYPKIDWIQGRGIIQNPLQGKVISTMMIPSGSIDVGDEYIVRVAQVLYNGVVYSPDDTFTGVAGVTTYTGNGLVYHRHSQRAVKYTDNMPIPDDMYPEIIMNILTKEYQVEATKIPDMMNDSKSESQING